MKRLLLKRALSVLLSVMMCFFCCFGGMAESIENTAFSNTGDAVITDEGLKKEDMPVLSRMLVLHCGGESYKETVSHLKNSLVASKYVASHDMLIGFSDEILEGYDVVYVDDTVLYTYGIENTVKIIENYVYGGGSVFLPNEAVNYFPRTFLGISNTVTLSGVPKGLVNAAKGTDLEPIGELVCDFSKLFEGYTHYTSFAKRDFGYSFVPSTAQSVVTDAYGHSIYTVNKHGSGYVFLTNPLLPNTFNINSFERDAVYFEQHAFAASSAGANALIKGGFASFVSKQKHGFALERTFGSYGTQPIAWQLHYEEITGIENDASIIFSDICKKYSQIPSFTLIRNTYKWFARYESLSYLDIEGNICTLDFNEGAYSNGTHVIAGNENLYTVEFENTGSYFEDLPTAKQRLFPCIYDYNNDGMSDVICGSSDGKFYVFITKSLNGRWVCDNYYTLKNVDGTELDAGEYSAPLMFDFDSDGYVDIISGDEEGNILFLKNNGNGAYSDGSVITTIDGMESMPILGDIDNDGKNELVVGSCDGKIYSFETGTGYLHSKTLVVEDDTESFMSPCIYDIDGDGRNDILAGTYNGYIKRYLSTVSGTYKNGGYIMANEPNYKGNNRVKFGNNCSPRFFDADGDGKNEIVCGSYEYGLNVPIDSPYFKYKKELTKQVQHIQNNNYYLGVHFYTNSYASPAREAAELEMHKKAFEEYGISTNGVGVNQHTWYTSSNSTTQTLESVRNAGLLWDSGWQSSLSVTAPQSSTENVLGFPGFIDDEQSMLAFNTATLLYLDDDISDLTAKYGLPVSIYYHCDFAYNNPIGAENDVKHVADYVDRNGLSFVKEDDFAKMAAASANVNVSVVFNDDGSFTLVPIEKSCDFPLYDKAFSSAVAVKLIPKTEDNIGKYSSDAQFCFTDNGQMTLTLNKNITVEKTDYLTTDKSSHIASVNIPCNFTYGDGMVVLSFDKNEYVEIKVKGKAECTAKGISTEYDGVYTMFKGFGIKSATVVFK